MTPRSLPSLCAAFVVLSLVATGPLVGIDVTQGSPESFGEGTATVTAVDVEFSELRVTDGRFGTDVSYLRVPTASVTVGSVTGRPRLVYLVRVPAVDIEVVSTTLVTEPSRTYTLDPGDEGVERGSVQGPVTATVTVRVQSFSVDRTITQQNITVEGQA
ncbi:hypothetical protein [Haloarcula pelagica]|uniref:hypothetical protein n=1 Tax=Haloarcula pelagica TaxID=3033389 RepID=UPI0024C338F7|nr:hypothetical protein [Halomicroarcula sp. YJ-61-S]